MKLIEAILMGILQGVTEFLPVSSSGHLAIFKNIFNIDTDTGILFDILLHLGTLIAIFIVYWSDIKKLIVEGFTILGLWFKNAYIWLYNSSTKGKKKAYSKVIVNAYRRFVILIMCSSIITGIIGILMKDFCEKAGEKLLIPGICLIITGFILLLSDKAPGGKKRAKSATYIDSIILGIVQGIATLPGISRSGSTITAGLLVGFDKAFAVKYSFIMSIPAILGAVLLELKDASSLSLDKSLIVKYVVGMIVAAVVGYFCIKTLIILIKNSKFKYFAYYCFAVGAIALIYNFLA